MTLKLTLKPGESVFVGTTRVSVISRSTCTVIIEGTSPVMRGAEWLDSSEAATPLDRFRYILQEMYLRNSTHELILDYFKAAEALFAAEPDLRAVIGEVNDRLLEGALWDAVRLVRYACRRTEARYLLSA